MKKVKKSTGGKRGKRTAMKDLSARKAGRVKGGYILPYIEQDNIITGAGPGAGPHVRVTNVGQIPK